MDSHQYAKQLKETAEHMLARPVVELEEHSTPHVYIGFWDKDKFVAAARSFGGGRKSFSMDDLHYEPNGTCIILSIGRAKVCRKIQDVKWECEPLLSTEEVEKLGEPSGQEVL